MVVIHMPRYHFVVCEPDHTHDDPDGMPLPNYDAAKDHGNRIMRELKDWLFLAQKFIDGVLLPAWVPVGPEFRPFLSDRGA